VIAETAIAAMLLIGAGLLFASFLKLQGTSSGMNPDNVLGVEINLPAAKYSETRRQTTFFHDIIERVKVLPGVQSAGAISFLPLAGAGAATGFTIEGRPAPAPGQGPVADVRAVSPDLFRAMGIRLLRGRVFDERDTANNKLAVVINQTAVNMYWPNEDPIGKTLNMPWGEPMIGEIVGIVEDVRLVSLDAAPRTTLYWNYLQFPYGSMNLVVRTANDPRQLAPAIRAELRAIDKDQPVASIRTMSDVLSSSVASPRFNTTLLLVFAGLALLLASVGIYGVMSFSVTQRTHEIGIRIALGARPAEVRRMVIAHGMTLAAAGIAVGIAGSLALTRLMTTLLYQVKATDPGTFALVAALLALVAFLANYLPARRATRIDPLAALRHE
jgi:putative ABC transport system permease protein